MNEHLKDTLKLLRSEVSKNLKVIKEKEKLARDILNSEPSGSERSNLLKIIYDENKMILEENNELLKIQHMIVDYMSKYLSNISQPTIPEALEIKREYRKKSEKNPDEIILKRPVDKEALFLDTVKGDILYNKTHPLFDDQDFYQKLMKHYIEIEAYEKCDELQQLKSFKNQMN